MNTDPTEIVNDDTPDNNEIVSEDVLPNNQNIESPNQEMDTISLEPNRKALISFVSSILCLFALWVVPIVGVVLSGVALVFGLKARKEIRVSNTSGSRLALTGLICGCLSLILSVVVCPLVLFALVAVITSS